MWDADGIVGEERVPIEDDIARIGVDVLNHELDRFVVVVMMPIPCCP